jgi:hypothetical protein
MRWKMIIAIIVLLYLAAAGISVLNAFSKEPVRRNEPLNIPKNTVEEPKQLKVKLSPSLPIEVIEKPDNMTITQILSAASQGDQKACDVEDNYVREVCMEKYYYSTAEREGNPDICLGSQDTLFVKRCMANSAITAVALAYYTESQNGTIIVEPTNIGLCDKLADEDKELCLNPALAIEKDYNQIKYKIK